jgi:hypothetical protein
MDSSDQRKVRKNMEEINPTESSGLSESPGLPESSETLSLEQAEALENAYVLDVATGGCKSCQSTWKPTRRDLIKTAFGAALVAGTLLESNAPAQAKQTPSDEAYPLPPGIGSCEEMVRDCVARATTTLAEDLNLCDEIPNVIARNLCKSGALAKSYMSFQGCQDEYALCVAARVLYAIGEAIAIAGQMIADNIVVIGETLLIGGVLIAFVACVVATSGICAVVVLA